MHFVWKATILALAGFMALRLAGRKSIAQMTTPTTVVMISVGSILIQPIVETSIVRTLGTVAIFVAALTMVEYLELKFNVIEKLITGKSIVVVSNGQLKPDNLRKIRMTVDKLEMHLRQRGIKSIADVKTATVEPNGQLGYELMPEAEPLTVGQFKQLMLEFFANQQSENQNEANIFDEVVQKRPDTMSTSDLK